MSDDHREPAEREEPPLVHAMLGRAISGFETTLLGIIRSINRRVQNRFNALAAGSGFSLPGALAEGNRLVVALPKSLGTGNLFEPPPFWKPAGGEILVRLERDIRAVLRMADTVIDLDFWAAGRKRDYTPAAAPGAPGYASVAGAAGLRRARAPCGRRRSVPSK